MHQRFDASKRLMLINLLGYLAALASMVSFLPQALKIIRSRETKDISAGMYALTVSAFALWLVYGAIQQQWPLVVSNSVCFALSAFILAMTVLPRKDREKIALKLTGEK